MFKRYIWSQWRGQYLHDTQLNTFQKNANMLVVKLYDIFGSVSIGNIFLLHEAIKDGLHPGVRNVYGNFRTSPISVSTAIRAIQWNWFATLWAGSIDEVLDVLQWTNVYRGEGLCEAINIRTKEQIIPLILWMTIHRNYVCCSGVTHYSQGQFVCSQYAASQRKSQL